MRRSVLTTIVTPASATDLTTLLNVKSDLALSGATPEDDIYFRRLIKQVSGRIQTYCNRVFAQQTYQDLIRLDHGHWSLVQTERILGYIPAGGPLVSVTSIVEDGITLVAGTDFEVDLAVGAIFRLDEKANRIVWRAGVITIVYVAGYTLPPAANFTLPSEVEEAVIRLIKSRWAGRDRDPLLKSQDIAGIGREEYWIGGASGASMPPDVEDLLDPHRIIVLA